jgi:Fe-S cluster biogenesis protein NfuA
MPKIVDIEYTPNPNAVKFILKEPITSGGSRSFPDAEAAQADPLAAALFDAGNVTSVFYLDRFITINKDDNATWEDLLKKLAVPIRAAAAITDMPLPEASATVAAPGENPLLDRINQVLDERIRPGLAFDGGGLEILGLDGYKLTIRYQGACGSCPSSLAGTLFAIEQLLKQEVDPEIEVISA